MHGPHQESMRSRQRAMPSGQMNMPCPSLRSSCKQAWTLQGSSLSEVSAGTDGPCTGPRRLTCLFECAKPHTTSHTERPTRIQVTAWGHTIFPVPEKRPLLNCPRKDCRHWSKRDRDTERESETEREREPGKQEADRERKIDKDACTQQGHGQGGGQHLRRRVRHSRSDGRGHPVDLPAVGRGEQSLCQHTQNACLPLALVLTALRLPNTMTCNQQCKACAICQACGVPAVALAILDHPSICRAILLNPRSQSTITASCSVISPLHFVH